MPITLNIYNKNNQYTTQNTFLDTKRNVLDNNINISRNDNCKTPFRMSLIGTRKTNECNDCEPNTKVLKDNHALYCCYNPYISNQQNKGGIRKNDFLYSNKHYLYSRNKSYIKNNKSNFINTKPITGSEHTYQTTPSDVSNNNIIRCHTATYKKSNYGHDKYGAVSQRSRINRLKYNAVKARLLTPKVNCDNYNKKCYDDDLARYRVDIKKPPICNPKTIFNKSNHTNKKLVCDPGYTGPKYEDKPQITYVFPVFQPRREPPPDNGLQSDYYHNNYMSTLISNNFNYKPLEFNTNYYNRNPTFIPGPVPTENTTDTNPDETYNFNVTEDTVTYTTQTQEITTITETDKKTRDTKTDIFLTQSITEEQILEGTPKIRIKEVKIMNKTIRLIVESENVSHWHYHINNSDHNMVYNGNTVIFNVNDYGTYNLNVHGVDLQHTILASDIKVFTIEQPTPRYITSGTIAPYTVITSDGVVSSETSNIISSSYDGSVNTTTESTTSNTATTTDSTSTSNTTTESTTTSNTSTESTTTSAETTDNNTNTSNNNYGY